MDGWVNFFYFVHRDPRPTHQQMISFLSASKGGCLRKTYDSLLFVVMDDRNIHVNFANTRDRQDSAVPRAVVPAPGINS